MSSSDSDTLHEQSTEDLENEYATIKMQLQEYTMYYTHITTAAFNHPVEDWNH